MATVCWQGWACLTTLALGYQGTEEAQVLGLPERRLEWRSDDYPAADGDTVTAQLAIAF